MLRYMSRLFVVLIALPAQAATSVVEHDGNIYCGERQLTDESIDRDPVLSPDGHTLAFMRLVTKAADLPESEQGGMVEQQGPDKLALWIGDCAKGMVKRAVTPTPVFKSRPSDGPDDDRRGLENDLSFISDPAFSPDGRIVYFRTDGVWATATGVHRYDLQTGFQRYVAAGEDMLILQNGPYRSDLVLREHRYHGPPDGGSYDPYFIVDPDGVDKDILQVPGTDSADAEAVLAKWLKDKKWQAH